MSTCRSTSEIQPSRPCSSSRKPLSAFPRRRVKSCTKPSLLTTRRCASRTSRVPGRCSAGSRKSHSKKGCAECCPHKNGRLRLFMSKKLIVLAMATILVAGLITAGATASGKQSTRRLFSVGIYDDGMTVGNPEKGFPILKNLRAQIVRVTLWWGGPIGVVGKKRPTTATNPADPAYNWANYDRAVQMAAKYKIKVLFSIVGTPSWANGSRSQRYAPTRGKDLQNFAAAAAKRYNGAFKPTTDDPALPAVHLV